MSTTIPVTPPEPPLGRPESDQRRLLPLTLVMLAVVVVLLTVVKAIFLPLAAALLVSLLFRPMVRRLERVGLRAWMVSLAIIALLLAVLAVGLLRLAEPLREWMTRLPQAISRLERWLHGLSSSLSPVTEVGTAVDSLAAAPTRYVTKVEIAGGGWTTWLLSSTGEALVILSVFLLALHFMLAHGDGLLRRAVAMIPGLGRTSGGGALTMGGDGGQRAAAELIADVERMVSRYLCTITLINLGLGIVISLAMYWLGLGSPMLWGAMAFLLNFLPYVGPFIGLVLVALASSIDFQDPGRAFLPPFAYACIIAIEGQLLTPLLLGRQLVMNPLVVFVWLLLLGWMWGILGALIAVPLLMVVKIISERIHGRRWIADLIAS